MAITKVTGDVVEVSTVAAAVAPTVGATLSATYTMRVGGGSCSDNAFINRTTCEAASETWTERKLELVSTIGSNVTVVSSIDLQTLYTDLGDLGE